AYRAGAASEDPAYRAGAASEDPAYKAGAASEDPACKVDVGRTFRSGFAWTLIVLTLFALPFCGAVGTGNPLQYGMRYTIAPWFALFALMLERLSGPARTRWAVPVGLAFLSASAAVYIVKGPLEAPYRLLA